MAKILKSPKAWMEIAHLQTVDRISAAKRPSASAHSSCMLGDGGLGSQGINARFLHCFLQEDYVGRVVGSSP